jgi:hypothetical protein
MERFPTNTPVVINAPGSSFHGLAGTVLYVDSTRPSPLPNILVHVPGSDLEDDRKEVFFEAQELSPVDTTVDTSN